MTQEAKTLGGISFFGNEVLPSMSSTNLYVRNDAFLIHVIILISLAYPLSKVTRFSGITSICASFFWLLCTHVRCTHRRIVLHLVRCVHILHGVKHVASVHTYIAYL